jgi:nucleoside-diphosphate-sugar epimerase
MRVFVAGATGVLGHRLIRGLVDAGHDAVGLARDERGEQVIREAGGASVRASLFDTDQLARVAEGCDTVIHAATAIPKKRRVSASNWAANDRIRREGTQALTDAAAKIGARHYIQQSIAWVARPPDDAPFDEDGPVYPDPVVASAIDAEQIAREAAATHGFTATVLRGGWFYGPDAWHTQLFGRMLRRRMLPIVGSGEACWSPLHLDDAASAFVHAVETAPGGTYHVVDDEPVTIRAFLGHFADRLGADAPMWCPVWLAKLVSGAAAAEMFTRSTVTSNQRFRAATGWAPAYPTYREGIDQVVTTWEREGFK